jgi:hypothetical protein
MLPLEIIGVLSMGLQKFTEEPFVLINTAEQRNPSPPLPLVLAAIRTWTLPYRKVERQVKVLIKNLSIFFLFPSKQFLPISFKFICGKLLPKTEGTMLRGQRLRDYWYISGTTI